MKPIGFTGTMHSKFCGDRCFIDASPDWIRPMHVSSGTVTSQTFASSVNLELHGGDGNSRICTPGFNPEMELA